MNFFALLLLGTTLFFGTKSYSIELVCSPDEYIIRGFLRKEFIKSDGTKVKATSVKTHCRKHTRESRYTINRFKNTFPVGWPHKAEKMVSWSEEEKDKFVETFKNYHRYY